MSWKITEQHLASVTILFMLFIRADKDLSDASKQKIDDVLALKGVSSKRVTMAIDELLKKGLVDTINLDDETRYEITRRGVHWIEDSFTFVRAENYTFYPKHKRLIIGKLQSELQSSETGTVVEISAVNWTKWGAIAGIAAVFVPLVIWWIN